MSAPVRVRHLASILVLAPLLACERATAVEEVPVVLLEPVTATAAQTVPVDQFVPIVPTVRAVTASGVPVPGQRVRFAITAGAGLLGQRLDTTDADGLASPGSWLLGYRAVPHELTAFLPDRTGDVTVSFAVTATPLAATIMTVGALPATIAIGDTVTIRVVFRDTWSNVVPPPAPLSFVSSDTLVARVSAAGLITAIGTGPATVTVTAGTFTRVIAISVPAGPPSVTATPVTIAQGYGVAIKDGTMLLPAFPAAVVNRIDVATQTITRTIVTPDEAVDAAFHPTLPLAYVTGAGGNLHVIDLATDSIIESVPVPGLALRVRVAPDGGQIYVTTIDGALVRVDAATYATTTLQLAGALNGLVVPATGDRLLVSSMSDRIYVVSRTSFTVTDSVMVPGQPQDIILGPDQSRFYLALEAGIVQARDFSTLAVLASTSEPIGGAFGLAISADGLYLVVARTQAASVDILDALSLDLYQSFASPSPRRVALDPTTGALWVSNEGNSTLLRIDF